MRRARIPDFLEYCANHPRVRPWIGGEGEIRAGKTWDGTIALEWREGGVIFMRQSPGVYEGHLVFVRVKDAMAKVREAVDYLFTHSDAIALTATVPEGYWHVARICRALGMTERGGHYVLTAQEWALHKERA